MPESYAETVVREVLTEPAAKVDAAVGYAALLLACVGWTSESDRLVQRWRAVTDRPATQLAEDPLTARAWAMLFEARGARPDWADDLPPLDIDAEEKEQRTHLEKGADKDPPLRAQAAEAESLAADGDLDGARAALARWAELARERYRPELAQLAACRHVATLLVDGTLAVPDEWARNYTGTLVAALHARYQPERTHQGWHELVAEIMRWRGEPDAVPPPAPQEAVADAERRLGTALPGEYRDFLLTCDGLPADVVFPRLLSASELAPGPGGVPISDDGHLVLRPQHGDVIEHDPVFGATTHPGVRALLEHHLGLLEAAG